jgi:hypothetical protein
VDRDRGEAGAITDRREPERRKQARVDDPVISATFPFSTRSSRISLMPVESRPLVGSSRDEQRRVAEEGGGDTQALVHSERVPAEAVRASRPARRA